MDLQRKILPLLLLLLFYIFIAGTGVDAAPWTYGDSCTAAHRSRIELWVATDQVARKHLTAYLGIGFTQGADEVWSVDKASQVQWKKVQKYIRRADRLLNQGVLAPAMVSPGMVLCDGNIRTRIPWSSAALGKDGLPLSKIDEKTKEVLEGVPVELSKIFDEEHESGLEPWWSQTLGTYMFEKPGDYSNMCTNPARMERTVLGRSVAGHDFEKRSGYMHTGHGFLIFMCPPTLRGLKKYTPTLGSKGAQAPFSDGTPNYLSNVRPHSATLLHEVFHAVSVNQDKDDFVTDPELLDFAYELPDILGLAASKPRDAVGNAESYTMFCLAYWYSMEYQIAYYPGYVVAQDWVKP
ncbi:hypothetical protein CNMCM6936_000144 [Aspergillus lentulus]|nr:hypothetical protein CNMCM6936_000144 [Aspergillus lentulus]KAF4183770.1 hypothetical protein CNMCM7927_008814 [Aspergillus lentulus]GFF54751.1 hypothetical protein IFM62136_02660 [Aspergillus lentulus]GFF95069.1 hypothetical protein IFM47457_10172 [Aspergillus lentulus]